MSQPIVTQTLVEYILPSRENKPGGRTIKKDIVFTAQGVKHNGKQWPWCAFVSSDKLHLFTKHATGNDPVFKIRMEETVETPVGEMQGEVTSHKVMENSVHIKELFARVEAIEEKLKAKKK